MPTVNDWKGENNPRWKGGRHKHTSGYNILIIPSHAKARSRGRIFEHRFLYEQYHKCCLLKWAVIHHINGNKSDNRIENLQPMTSTDNIKRHYIDRRAKILPNRQCVECGSRTTHKRKTMDRFLWYFLGHDPTKPVCNTCRARLQKDGRM
jgi:hypothetical protein